MSNPPGGQTDLAAGVTVLAAPATRVPAPR